MAVGCSAKSGQRLLRCTGDIKPRTTARSALRLSEPEREEISRGLQAGDSCRAMARRLGRSPSTVSCDAAAGGGRAWYRAWRAEEKAHGRLRRPKTAKLVTSPRLRAAVVRGLKRRWSPQQIVARLVREYPDDPEMRVSHETIHQSLFVQGRGTLRRELTRCLRSGRAQRRPRGRVLGTGQLKHMVLFSDRPADIADRAVPGHWEGDLILGKQARSAIGTLVERQTRFVVLVDLC
jgi:IS30 family transposase